MTVVVLVPGTVSSEMREVKCARQEGEGAESNGQIGVKG